MYHAVLLSVSLCLSSASIAQVWVPFADCGGAEQLRSYSYDPSSVANEGSNRIVSIKGDYSRVRGSLASEGRILWAVDCEDRTYAEQSRTELRADGTVHSKYDTPTERMAISPDSVADKLSKEICVRTANRP